MLLCVQMISSPEDVADCESGHERTSVSGSKFSTPSKARRGRVPYSQTEEENLIAGVDKFGNSWTQILCSYEFHPCRTAVDLKEKFQRMKVRVRIFNIFQGIFNIIFYVFFMACS